MGRHKAHTRNPAYVIRDAEMILMYRDGKTLQEIGDRYGITRERVRQRMEKMGLTTLDGGRTMRALKKIPARAAKRAATANAREANHFVRYGMSRADMDGLSQLRRTDPKHPIRLWERQRMSAKHRGIEWQMTFADWWRIWQESGKWEQRGRGQGYCMARWADDGPYSPDNVYICTIGQNFSDSYITKPAAMRVEKARITRLNKQFRIPVGAAVARSPEQIASLTP